MIRRRIAQSRVRRSDANAVIRRVLFRIWDPGWKTILLYVNRPEEVATRPFIRTFLRRRFKVCVPAYDGVRARYFPSRVSRPARELVRGRFGVLEPRISTRRRVPRRQLDLILVPGLAFDPRGNRLGHGHGYFDQLCRATRAAKIGLAYHFQLVDRLTPHAGDVQMDMIITEKGIIHCRKS